MTLIHELENLGLTEKETRVYLALLEVGHQSVQNISKKASVNRATTYVILDSLSEKGLVSTFERNGKTEYAANEPQSLKGFLELKQKEIEEKSKHLDRILPELRSLHNKGADKPTIRYFEGEQGLIQSVEEFYGNIEDMKEPIYMLYSRDKIEKSIDEKLRSKLRARRLKKKVYADVMYTYTQGDLPAIDESESIRIDEKEYPVEIDLEIHGDTVFVSTLGEKLSAILIKNKDIAETLKTLFKLAKRGTQK